MGMTSVESSSWAWRTSRRLPDGNTVWLVISRKIDTVPRLSRGSEHLQIRRSDESHENFYHKHCFSAYRNFMLRDWTSAAPRWEIPPVSIGIEWSWLRVSSSGQFRKKHRTEKCHCSSCGKTDAARNMLEMIKGINLSSSTTMRDAMVQNDTIRTQVQGGFFGLRPSGKPAIFWRQCQYPHGSLLETDHPWWSTHFFNWRSAQRNSLVPLWLIGPARLIRESLHRSDHRCPWEWCPTGHVSQNLWWGRQRTLRIGICRSGIRTETWNGRLCPGPGPGPCQWPGPGNTGRSESPPPVPEPIRPTWSFPNPMRTSFGVLRIISIFPRSPRGDRARLKMGGDILSSSFPKIFSLISIPEENIFFGNLFEVW